MIQYPHALYFFLTCILFTSCSSPSNSQVKEEASTTAENLVPQVDRSDDKKLQIAEYVVEVFEDSQHQLWLGTMSKGVARYDANATIKQGRSALTYFDVRDGLNGPTISSIAEDKYGNLWFGGHKGLSRWNYTSDENSGMQFINLWESEGIHDDKDGMGWVGVTQDSQGNIWANSNLGIFRYEDSSPTEGEFVKFEVPIDQSVIENYSITSGRISLELIDSKGNIWFSADGYGLIKYDGSTFSRFTKEDGLCSNTINSVAEDLNGDLWIVCMQSYQPEMTKDGGLCKLEIQSDGNTVVEKFPGIKGLSGEDLYSLYCDSKGNIWVGASGLGIYRFSSPSFETFNLFEGTNRMDLTNRMGIQSILEDHTGNMWFGFSGGLFRLQDSKIINVTKLGPWNE